LRPTNIDELGQHKVPFVYNFSPSLVPRPLDWYEWIHVTGFWFLDNPDNSTTKSWSPSPELLSFMEKCRSEGKKLVYIGWGSIVVPDAAEMTRQVIEAVKKSGVRAILSKGWSDRLLKDKNSSTSTSLEPEPSIFEVNSIPHDWLFPKVDAACHHGGAGTLGATLRAGIPVVVKPYFGDQFFWGNQVEMLGVGSCVRKFSVNSLAKALENATRDEKTIERAKNMGRMIAKEDGVGEAIKAIYRDLDYARSLIKKDTKIEMKEKGNGKKLSSGTIRRDGKSEELIKDGKVEEKDGESEKIASTSIIGHRLESSQGKEQEEGPLGMDIPSTAATEEAEQELMSNSGQFSSSDGWSVVSEEERVEARRAGGVE